ncbi:MAG TPA: hypothetical protein DCW53_01770 [Rikenellaceae bacterium]|nr:hypothetical protein [Rikenellaceae bacterium]
MRNSGSIVSESSRRIAKNTLLLYVRMLVLMFVGLFTSRVVLSALGETDYGVYNAVGGMVTVFTFVTASISAAISRYLAFEIGRSGEVERLRKVFSAGSAVLVVFALILVVLAETLGRWFLYTRMNIPPDRVGSAGVVLQCSLVALVVQLLSVPYNAAIIAHEKMSAFAFISLLEAALKLVVAIVVKYAMCDKLVLYAVLVASVALVVRLCYGLYCRAHFAESRGKFILEPALMKEMLSFSGWNFFGSGAYVLNTQGVTVLVNIFFGVAMNAARGVAMQIENIAKQFVSNFLTAINPQITKSWAAADRDRCFSLVFKASKFSCLGILVVLIPLMFEAESVLGLWLTVVPEHSSAFVRLALVGLMLDMFGNPLLTLMLATGKVRNYYLVTGLTSFLCLPLVWASFRLGAPAEWSYWGFISVYAIVFLQKLLFVRSETGFPIMKFLKKVVLPLLVLIVLSSLLPFLVYILLPQGIIRLLLVCIVSWGSIFVLACITMLTPGERAFVTRKLGRSRVPLRWALEDDYYEIFGRRPNLKEPLRYTEKIQKYILKERNPLFHRLVDKLDVKQYVASAIGEEYVVPTIGTWNRVEDIDWEALPEKFVLKCTHDSGSAVICEDKSSFDYTGACLKLSSCLKRDYWKSSREWAYKGLSHRIIAEPFLPCLVKSSSTSDVCDYKFFCFNGVPKVMFVATDRNVPGRETKFDFFDMDFRRLDFCNGHPNADSAPLCPEKFELMKLFAARLSAGIPQVRVDFYEIGGKVYFGEFTFYHWRGLVPFEPDEWDFKMGSLWGE